jgi:hypothetical protein
MAAAASGANMRQTLGGMVAISVVAAAIEAGCGGSSGANGSITCTIQPTASTSPMIPTVGIVSFASSLADVQSAQIDFGLTNSYGMTAPVNLAQPSYRTLLLGMKATKTYHYRITVTNSTGSCRSGDNTITTGAMANGLPQVTVSPATSANTGLAGGFLITGHSIGAGTMGSPAYILDADGDYVWWFNIDGDVSNAQMSYDGSHMWINSVNVGAGAGAGTGAAHVHRVSMDGLSDEDLSSQFTGQNHQLTIEPDETVAFYAYGSNGCDDVREYDPSTATVRTIVNAQTAQQLDAGTMCHLNNIQYSKPDDALVFSDLDSSTIVKVKRTDGSVIWNLNGAHKTISAMPWTGGQHGIDLIDLTRILFFANNNGGTIGIPGGFGDGGPPGGFPDGGIPDGGLPGAFPDGGFPGLPDGGIPGTGGPDASDGSSSGSAAIEIALDTTTMTATTIWSYTANPPIANMVMGDVQRMPNGNTVVGFSTKGVLHEVSADGTLLQSWTWPAGATFGYIEKRTTLYGPPPR